MNKETLKRGNELAALITSTQKGLSALLKWTEKTEKTETTNDPLTDSRYYLTIAAHSDGSGGGGSLYRHEGNDELLEIIINTLTRQLKDFQTELDNL